MQKIIKISMVSSVCFLLAIACSKQSANNGENAVHFSELQPESCQQLAASTIKVRLGQEWQPYLASTRFCRLVKPGETDAAIILISVFTDDYYRDKPDGAVWEDFPKPVLINKTGEIVGNLVELFPYDLPSEMNLRYGNWQGNIPGEIRMHVIANTVVNTYDLPTLSWNKEKQRYVAQDDSSKK
jgi:hypothetical protein